MRMMRRPAWALRGQWASECSLLVRLQGAWGMDGRGLLTKIGRGREGDEMTGGNVCSADPGPLRGYPLINKPV